MEFSGRTTNHASIHDDRWKTDDKGKPAVRKQKSKGLEEGETVWIHWWW